jgi:uncharacterized protein
VWIVLSLRAVRSLDEIDASDWAAVARASGFYLSHEWLRLVEADASATAEYLLGYDGGRLVAALPLYEVHTESLGLYRPTRLADGRWRGRYLLAGSRRGFVNGFLVAPGLPGEGRAEAFRALLPAVRERVRARDADGALFLHLPTAAAGELLRALAGEIAGLPLLALVDCAIDVPGQGMDDYVRSIPRPPRSKIRREMRVFGEAGYEIGEERLAGCLAEAKPLLCNLQHRYGHLDDDERWRSELDHMADMLGHRGVVFTARRGGSLVGFALGYPFGGTMYIRWVGFDYEALAGAFEYFNLGFYLPLRYAYRHGLRRLHLGPTAYDAKVRRGAVLAPRWSLAVFDRASRGTAADLDWNRQAAGEWFGRYERGSPALADPGWGMWGCAGDDRG